MEIKKRKKSDTVKLKEKFWKIFSVYIRRRDKGVCFTCGLKKHWKQMQAGHCIPRSIGGLALYFNEMNVHCQCYRCNINLGGNGAVYIKKIEEVYGKEGVDELFNLKNKITQYTDEDYKFFIEEYKNEIKFMGEYSDEITYEEI